MLQNISPSKAETYFEQGKLTDWRTTFGPIGPPPPDNKSRDNIMSFIHVRSDGWHYHEWRMQYLEKALLTRTWQLVSVTSILHLNTRVPPLCSPSVETPGQACAQLPAWSQAVWRCWGPPQPSSGAPASLPAFYSFLRRSVHCGNVWNNVSKLSFVWVLVLHYWRSSIVAL